MAKPLTFYQTLNQAPKGPKHGKHRRASAPSHRSPVVGTDHGTGKDDTFAVFSWNTGWFAFDQPKPPAIPYAGIRAGEIIGHRLWLLVEAGGQQHLRSLAHHRLWAPGETVEGDTSAIVNSWGPIYGGTYAFKDRGDCNMEIAFFATELMRVGGRLAIMGDVFGDPGAICIAVVVGTVKMWGEVVEHETGYRAEFAKLQSIDELYGGGDIEELRARYFVHT